MIPGSQFARAGPMGAAKAPGPGDRMSTYRVNKLLFDLQMQPDLWEEFLTTPAPVAERYGLTADEARAVIEVDATALSRSGVQPYLLRFYTVRRGMSNEELIRQLERA
jgi:hypothetical protein